MSRVSLARKSGELSYCVRVDRHRSACRIFCVIAFALAIWLTAAVPARAQYEDLLKRIPGTANAMMVVNVQGFHNSPIGKAQHWTEKHQEAYISRPIILPPEADWIVLGAMFDPETNGTIWNLGVMSLSEDPSMRAIARAEGGYLDTINEHEAAWTPSNAYFVHLEKNMMGVMYPAHRQLVSRWIDYAKKTTVTNASSYLQQAASIVKDKNYQIVLAIDLQDMVRPHVLKQRLEEAEALKGKKVDLDALRAEVISLKGATFTVSLKDKAYGRLQVDFGEDIKAITPFAKELIIEALDDAGAHLDELKDWKLNVYSHSLSLSGELTTSGMRRIGSVLELPSTKFVTQESSEKPMEGPDGPKTKVYYRSVTTLVDDLQKTLKETRDNHAVWMENYAKKIDGLPILNIDDEMLAFGAQTAERFRQTAVAKRSSLIRAGVRKSQTYDNYVYGYYGNTYAVGGYNSSTAAARRSVTMQESANAMGVRIDLWKAIDDDTAKIRVKMTQKYQIEF